MVCQVGLRLLGEVLGSRIGVTELFGDVAELRQAENAVDKVLESMSWLSHSIKSGHGSDEMYTPQYGQWYIKKKHHFDVKGNLLILHLKGAHENWSRSVQSGGRPFDGEKLSYKEMKTQY
jgi:hypothetical protein